ncbi:hypothetical protein KAZ66_01920 [Candidatus Woesebacteria bacterium]|nr:hypothetical protein [Candidatus Woesebacteria bacterium]
MAGKLESFLIQSALYKRFFQFINFIPKRIRIVAATIVMTLLLLSSSFFPFGETWYVFLSILFIISYITTYLAIFEGISGVEWYMLFVTSIILTLATYLFYFLLPVRWLTRVPLVLIFGLAYYAALLTSNIFNVGVEKSLQLYRAAFSVNYFLQSFIVFLLLMVIYTFKQNFMINGIASGVAAGILSLQLYWSVTPDATFNRRLLDYAMMTAILLFQFSVMISFIPLKTNVAALIFTAAYYSLTGIIHHHLGNRLFPNIIKEYIFVFIFVCFIALLTLQW